MKTEGQSGSKNKNKHNKFFKGQTSSIYIFEATRNYLIGLKNAQW